MTHALMIGRDGTRLRRWCGLLMCARQRFEGYIEAGSIGRVGRILRRDTSTMQSLRETQWYWRAGLPEREGAESV